MVDSDAGSDSDDLKSRMDAVSNSDYVEQSKPSKRGPGVNDSQSSFDPQEFIFQKKQSLDHFFITVYEQLSQAPYSL